MPGTPTILVTANNTLGCLEVAITNSGTTDHNEVWLYESTQAVSEAIKIGDNVAENGSFSIFSCASGKVYYVFVRAVDGSDTADSSPTAASVTLSYLHVHIPTKTNRTSNALGLRVALNNQMPEGIVHTRGYQTHSHGGRSKPVVSTDDGDEQIWSVLVRQGDLDSVEDFRRIFNLKTTLCFRDQKGEMVYGTVDEVAPVYNTNLTDVALTITETSYSPAITSSTVATNEGDALLLEDGFYLTLEGGTVKGFRLLFE